MEVKKKWSRHPTGMRASPTTQTKTGVPLKKYHLKHKAKIAGDT